MIAAPLLPLQRLSRWSMSYNGSQNSLVTAPSMSTQTTSPRSSTSLTTTKKPRSARSTVSSSTPLTQPGDHRLICSTSPPRHAPTSLDFHDISHHVTLGRLIKRSPVNILCSFVFHEHCIFCAGGDLPPWVCCCSTVSSPTR